MKTGDVGQGNPALAQKAQGPGVESTTTTSSFRGPEDFYRHTHEPERAVLYGYIT